MSKAYRIEEGGLHEQFQKSRAKVQLFGGGFGNGKTTGAVVKALQLAKDYPGSNGLVARSTYPKLTATIRKEFRAWCPKSWVKRDIDSKQNLMELTNGSIINFSHIQQSGKSQESSTSNLLSATYDWIVIDQVEDPEISHKDFLDLLGRLRGQTTYQGDDPTMPTSGPRWMILMCNPTRNWVYRKLVKPVQDYKRGINNPELLRDDETGEIIIELFEGSTYENKDNLPADFIKTLETTYRGQMRERYLMGQWGAFEGLIYPEYDPTIHMLNHDEIESYYWLLMDRAARMTILESYDHGIAQPACYEFGFADDRGNVFILDGFYEKEQTLSELAKSIRSIRRRYGYYPGSNLGDPNELRVLADPSIFKRVSGNSATVGTSTSGLFQENGVRMQRANNDIMNGIIKVQGYLSVDPYHRHPIYEEKIGAPRLYISKKLEFIDNEITDYYWKKDTSGEYEDIPNDKNDHAMDAIKYLLSDRPRPVIFRKASLAPQLPSHLRRWREAPEQKTDMRKHRHHA